MRRPVLEVAASPCSSSGLAARLNTTVEVRLDDGSGVVEIPIGTMVVR